MTTYNRSRATTNRIVSVVYTPLASCQGPQVIADAAYNPSLGYNTSRWVHPRLQDLSPQQQSK